MFLSTDFFKKFLGLTKWLSFCVVFSFGPLQILGEYKKEKEADSDRSVLLSKADGSHKGSFGYF